MPTHAPKERLWHSDVALAALPVPGRFCVLFCTMLWLASSDWLFTSPGWLLLAAGAILAAWALFRNRSRGTRGRTRRGELVSGQVGKGCSPTCRACGYDLSGAFASARGAWPLMVVCSECGAAFESSKLWRLSWEARWSFVHGERLSLRKWLATSIITLGPFGLWPEAMRVPPRSRGRVLMFAGSWILIMLFCMHNVAAMTEVMVWRWTSRGTGPWREVVEGIIFPYPLLLERLGGVSVLLIVPLMAALVPQAIMGLGMLAITSLRRAGIPKREVLMTLAHAMPGAGLVAMLLYAGQTVAQIVFSGVEVVVHITAVAIAMAVLAYPAWLALWWMSVGVYLRISPWVTLIVAAAAIAATGWVLYVVLQSGGVIG